MTVVPRNVAASSLILLAENIVRLAAVAAISFWIARRLGPSQFGILNFASALMTILLSVSEMGMEVPITLRLTRAARPGALLGTVLSIRSVASVLMFLLGIPLVILLKPGDATAQTVTLIVSTCVMLYVANAFDFYFKARTEAATPALARTVGTLVAGAAKALCLMFSLSLMFLAWTVVLEAAVASLGLYYGFRRSTAAAAGDALSWDGQLLKPLIRDCLPYFFSTVAVFLYMKVDVVMLGYLSTNLQTGIYSLSQKLSEVIQVVPVILITTAYPSMARRFLDSKASSEESAQMLFDLGVGASILAVLIANVLAGPVILGIFGRAYEPSVHIFYLHSWSCIAVAMTEARHRWLATQSLQRYAPMVTAIGLVLNVALNLVLIPRFGAFGAAIATVVSYFVTGYLTSFLFAPLRAFGRAQTRALWPWMRLYRAARLWHTGALSA